MSATLPFVLAHPRRDELLSGISAFENMQAEQKAVRDATQASKEQMKERSNQERDELSKEKKKLEKDRLELEKREQKVLEQAKAVKEKTVELKKKEKEEKEREKERKVAERKSLANPSVVAAAAATILKTPNKKRSITPSPKKPIKKRKEGEEEKEETTPTSTPIPTPTPAVTTTAITTIPPLPPAAAIAATATAAAAATSKTEEEECDVERIEDVCLSESDPPIFLVKWLDYEVSENTWQSLDSFAPEVIPKLNDALKKKGIPIKVIEGTSGELVLLPTTDTVSSSDSSTVSSAPQPEITLPASPKV